MNSARIHWTKEELKILRDAWVRGMTAKCISSMVLKHRTPGAIQRALHVNGMKFNGGANYKPQPSIVIGVPVEMHEQLKSSAAAQGITVRRLCRDIIQNELRGLNVRRTGSYSKEYKRDWMREWRARQRQKGSTK